MKRLVVLALVIGLIGLGVQAATLSATVLLPDGKGAPLAQVSVGGQTFVADAQGRVELTVGDEKTAVVKWLMLEQQIPLGAQLKFSNRVLYSAPYDEFDWIVEGKDHWEISDNSFVYTESAEGQITLDDEFEDFIFRARVVIHEAKQWNYVRFFLRTPPQSGFAGYALSLAGFPNDFTYFVRFDGQWNNYKQLTPALRIAPPLALGQEYEVILTAKGPELTGYLRAVNATSYTQIFSLVDDSAEAFEYGGISILNSFTTMEVADLAIYRF